MSRAHSAALIDLSSLSWPATMRGNDVDGYEVESDGAPDDATLQAEVDAAPADTSDDVRSAALARLRELYAKGWANLTNTEKAEIPKLVTGVLAT